MTAFATVISRLLNLKARMHHFYDSSCRTSRLLNLLSFIVFTLALTNLKAQTYCPSSSSCGAYKITNVSVTGDNNSAINNNTGATCAGYSDFTSQIVTMSATNSPYVVTVNSTAANTTSNAVAALYVDWNNDGTFDPEEGLNALYVNGAYTFAVIPTGTGTGLRRMRICSSNGSAIGEFPAACDPRTDGGETEDYSILLINPLDTIPACVDKSTVMPKDSATNVCQKTKITWGEVTDAVGYQFSLFNGSTAIVKDDSVTTPEYIPATPLIPGIKYTWIAIPYSNSSLAFSCDTLEFTISPNPDPSISFLPGKTYDVCQGTTLSIDGNPVDGTTPYKHSWNGVGVDNKQLSDTAIANPVFTASLAPGDYRYSYKVTDKNNCSATDTMTLTVMEKPVAGTADPKPSTICDGDSTSLIVFGSKGTIGWEYASSASGPWTFTTLNKTNDTIFSTGPLSADRYFRHTATIGVCIETGAPVKVTVNPIPVKPIVNIANDSICQGDSITLYVTNHSTGVMWRLPFALQDTIVAKTTGKYVAEVNVNGCKSTSDTTYIKVNAYAPKPSILVTGKNPACDGDTIKLKSSVTGNNVWSTSETTDQILVTTSGTFTVTQTNVAGCNTTSDSYTTTFNSIPAKPVITNMSAATFCIGGSVQLASSYVGGNKWNTGSTKDTITASTANDYIVTYTDSNGCSAFSDPFTVKVNPLPAKPVITASSPMCQGTPAYLYSTGVGSKFWSDSSTTDTITINTNGAYTVTLTDTNGCSATSTSYTATFEALPAKPTITQSGNILTASSGGASYQWYDINGPIAGATTRTYQPTSSGYYYVRAISAKGCVGDTSAMKAFHGLGISSTSATIDVTVFPNPATDAFTIMVGDNNAINAFKLIDLSGRTLLVGSLVKGANQLSVDLAAGTYILELMNNEVITGQRRVIIQ